MLRVAWLCQYNVFKLLPEIELHREITLHNSSWIHNLSDELVLNREIELHIITHSHLIEKTQEFLKNGINFHIIKYNFPFTKKGFPWYFPMDKLTAYRTFKKEAKKIIKQIHPDVLHVHGTEGGYFLPTFKLNIPTIISIQGIIRENMKIEPAISGFFQIPYENFAIKKGLFFGCRTDFDTSYIKKRNNNAIIFDLPEAINRVFFETQWNPEPGLSLVFVGSIIKRKGIEDLISSLSILKIDFPAIQLKIIGSGSEKYIKYLKKILKVNRLTSHVLWLGNRTSDEIALALSKSTFFVLPTLIDNSPNSLAEAMALGIPSIATNTGGIPSMINDKFDGMLFEKHDIIGLAEIIKELVYDKQLQKKLNLNGQKRVYERNFPTKVSKLYFETYNTLIK